MGICEIDPTFIDEYVNFMLYDFTMHNYAYYTSYRIYSTVSFANHQLLL